MRFPHLRRRLRRASSVLLAAVAMAGCGDDPLEPDPSVAPLVAQWEAFRLVMVNKANPQVAPDLIAIGVSFVLDVQPSGQYQATLTAFGQPQVEFGRVEVSGNQLVFRKEAPPPPRSDAGTWRISGDTLFLQGDTEFDFNLDGNLEPATLHADMRKRR